MPPRIDPPLALLAELTHRCPLSCPYCSNPVELERAASELGEAEWRRVLAEAASLGVLQVHFSGGEPMARRDLPALIATASEHGLYSNLITEARPENRPFLRECIGRSVQSALSVTVATYSTLSELGAQINCVSSDLIVLSLLGTSGEGCANTLKDLSEFSSGRPVIALASTNDAELARAAIRYGAKGFIPVTMGFEIALEVMRFVLAGGTYVPADCLLMVELGVPLVSPTKFSRLGTLTARELWSFAQSSKVNRIRPLPTK